MDTPDSSRDIYRLPLDGNRKPVPLLIGIDDDKQPRVSPGWEVARLRLQRLRAGKRCMCVRWPVAHEPPSRATAAESRSGPRMGSGSTTGPVPG